MSASKISRFGHCWAAWRCVAVAAVCRLGCGINSVPTAEEAAKAKWADVQAAFQERANLVPNLAAVAKGAAEQEKGILTGVIEARAKATSIQLSADDLNDPAKMAVPGRAEPVFGLAGGFGRLLANVEAYPEPQEHRPTTRCCKASLKDQENRIRVSIRDYNEAVRVITPRSAPSPISSAPR
jgi:LemA protein